MIAPRLRGVGAIPMEGPEGFAFRVAHPGGEHESHAFGLDWGEDGIQRLCIAAKRLHRETSSTLCSPSTRNPKRNDRVQFSHCVGERGRVAH